MTRKDKEAFKKRMAAGRRKAAKARGEKNPRKKQPKKKAKRGVTTPAKKNSGKPQSRKSARRVTAGSRRAGQPQKRAKNARRRNSNGSIEEASALYESFHGKPPSSISEIEFETRYREHFAELGKLIELQVQLNDDNPDFPFTQFGNCKVVATPDGENIYFIGGDQSIDLAALDISSNKDCVELGPCTYISYHTKKGFHDFEPTTYWHEFGEEDGIVPRLVYDRLNQRLFLTSGNYRVRPEGIVN